MILTLLSITKFFFWISIGIIVYNKLSKTKKGFFNFIFLTIQKLNLLELFIIIFTFFICLSFLSQLLYLNLEHLIINNTDIIYNWAADATNTVNAIDPTNTANTVKATNTVNTANQSIAKNVASTVGNSAIMTAGFGVGAKIAQSAPTIAGKIGGLALGLATGTSGIILKNIAENINADIFKKKFISVDISKIFNLTGNNAVDLLNIIQFCQYSQIIILLFIFYYFIIININESKLDSFLTKYLPSSLNNNFKIIIFKYINYLKKSSFFLLIYFFLLLIILNYLSYYYLDFFIQNLNKIVETYLNNK
jgi:hypothetical protein